MSKCLICGYGMEWVSCWNCGGQGYFDGETLMDEDPLWYSEDDEEMCDVCRRAGGWWVCPNGAAPARGHQAHSEVVASSVRQAAGLRGEESI